MSFDLPEGGNPEPPSQMRCVEIVKPGGPDVLRPTTRPIPSPGPDEILIRVRAAGVNRPDALQRAGAYDPPPGASDLPGLEAAGVVVEAGAAVSRWRLGDKVCALLPGGGYAEYATTHADHALPWPDNLRAEQAAALPETFFTVWSNVFDRAGLKAGETFLVHGGASGIGTTAIQLARIFGARVFTTVGSPEKAAACEALGAERAIDYRAEDFVAVTRELTQGRGVDVILDMVGGDYIPRNVRAAADSGRIVSIAFLNGAKAELNFAQVMVKRLTLTGSTLRPRSIAEKAAIADALREKVWPLIEAGRIAPVMDSTLPLDDAAAAHARMESSAHIGKIVLIP
ncbi:MAG: NAD(P)H-quinone oxidoreductase [Rubrimonas sp.]|uniref:NAD(P)H-quinone oxidoreductase n=1 Tax=Rubrimonas sp. TaxID=2036015 RepID=UPI002FDD4117